MAGTPHTIGRTSDGSRRTRSPAQPRGFTLIELLVVISIISLLIAILLPAIRMARYHANLAVCASQLRQLHLATMTYVSDHQGNFPDFGWSIALYEGSYHRSEEAGFYCPIDADSSSNYLAWRTPGPGWHYAMSPALTQPSYTRPTLPTYANISQIAYESQALLLSDGGWRGRKYNHSGEFTEYVFHGRLPGPAWGDPPHMGPDRLTRGINIVYVDGHGEFVARNPNHIDLTTFRASSLYPFNHKPFWAIPGTRSWDVAPHP